MSITPLTTEPAVIYAGDTISWLIAVPDYPASDGWTLKYKAVNATGYFALTSVASGDQHVVTGAKATTAAFPPGTYNLVKYVESATELVTLAESHFVVNPCLSGKTAAFDNRTNNEKILDAIDAVIAGTATTDQQKLTIDGTALERRNPNDLLRLRNSYAGRVYSERNPGKIGPSVKISFGDPTW